MVFRVEGALFHSTLAFRGNATRHPDAYCPSFVPPQTLSIFQLGAECRAFPSEKVA